MTRLEPSRASENNGGQLDYWEYSTEVVFLPGLAPSIPELSQLAAWLTELMAFRGLLLQ